MNQTDMPGGQYQQPHSPYGQNQPPFDGPPPQQPKTTMAGVALALGIAAMILPIPVIDVIAGVLGIVFAAIARKSGVGGLAIAALVVSIIGTVMALFYTIFVIAFGVMFFDTIFDVFLNEITML